MAADDITLVYSGGGQNVSPAGSVGGFPSPTEIGDDKNNLFDNITSAQTSQGATDYKCFYVFNDETDRSCTAVVWTAYLGDSGATVELGLVLQNESHRLLFGSTPSSGTFTVTAAGLTSSVITWDADPEVLAVGIAEAVTAGISECTVVANTTGHDYRITFRGILAHKAFSLLTVTNNLLVPAATPTVTRYSSGSPINTIAPDTGSQKVAPTGVSFAAVPSPGVSVGRLNPSEGFPVWVKRSIAAGFDAVDEDGFVFHMKLVGST